MMASAHADVSLKDLPAPALAAIHTALCEVDEEGCSSFQRDAATFRSTCKNFKASAILPSSLELHYRHAPPTADTLMGLKQLLDTQPNACKQLTIYMGPAAKPARPTEAGLKAGGIGLFFGTSSYYKPPLEHISREGLLALAALDTHLTHLDVPSLVLLESVTAVREALPRLQSLVLRLSADSELQAPEYLSAEDDCVSNEDGIAPDSQLRELTLHVPPGGAPFSFDGEHLDLTDFPRMERFVLQGPIAQQKAGDRPPFKLPQHAKVTVDPCLRGRRPTPWARTLQVYEQPVPGSAVPVENEYRDEDALGRQSNFEAIADKVDEYTSQIFRSMPIGHVPDCLSAKFLEEAFYGPENDREYYRSDLLLLNWGRHKDDLAGIVIERYGDKYAHLEDSSSDSGNDFGRCTLDWGCVHDDDDDDMW
ncbi:hypothetical protein DUNSADRAFT_17599 [Dunaliella salina]|uniref:Uncharacterized protein n=1 Tax=Dunaliella salina TaxID=3046 RepID=A0ABQ7G1G3_DUNSA|nr:hypothetical protein DUNSADRAFT_17599 [Dunaliella salina]KAF5828450.1 hypothetical protein DUNSADRAFT_17599 [Dunaliella salina]|eukprot:KAF5828449.1 hypothetical protein DUNSADRAFT_17599 [Dunaliella salina]